jgi:DNA primase
MLTDNFSPVQANLVTIVSKYVLLEESRRNLKGRCPFHKDLTTSLMVSPDKNIFKCFGCGMDGGPVEFVMLIENKSREDAIRLIGQNF